MAIGLIRKGFVLTALLLVPICSLAQESLLVHFQCNRCHEIPGIEEVPIEKSCVRCHQQRIADVKSARTADISQHIKHLIFVPSLANIGQRLKRAWFLEFVQRPHVIRPALGATMPKLPISLGQANQLADELGFRTDADSDLKAGDARQGAKIFMQRQCNSCHQTDSSEPIDFNEQLQSIPWPKRLAPNLTYTLARWRSEALLQWLQKPSSLVPGTLMPEFGFQKSESEDILAYLRQLPVPVDIKEYSYQPKLLSRIVLFREVNEHVFHKVCRHCHSNAYLSASGGGPGNVGGYGYQGKGLDLSAFSAILRGSRDGWFHKSVLADEANNIPKLVNHLIARHREVRTNQYTETLGMPLGLPPIGFEDIDLVYSWIRQGAKR